MNALVYLSPVPWASFAQRPHKYVEWHRATHQKKVLWVEPYPTRLPVLADLHRLGATVEDPQQYCPPWMKAVQVRALPVEPVPGVRALNRLLWRPALETIGAFASNQPCELVIGKPSQFALQLLRSVPFLRRTYDAMDDFPAFHGGLSSEVLRSTERSIAARVDLVQVSSSALETKFRGQAERLTLVPNACDPSPMPEVKDLPALRKPDVIGYIGTLAHWFDWDILQVLACAYPTKVFRLIGPLHGKLPTWLPPNVEVRPGCTHSQAMLEMAQFSVGLIPFRCTSLTASVDPVKYYEYRALGIPVVATSFGQMKQHAAGDTGVFLIDNDDDPASALARASRHSDSDDRIHRFRSTHAWKARFEPTLER